MTASFTFFGHPESGHSYKVKLMLAVCDLAYDYRIIDIWQPHHERPEPFRSLAKFQEVPLLLHKNQVYVQSDAILCFLAEYTGQFGGEDQDRMNRVREWLFWEANRLGLCLPHLRYARHFAPQEYPEGSLDWLQQRYETDIARLNTEFADGRSFILDDKPTIADFAICGYLFWADQAKVSIPGHVSLWLERLSRLPGWQEPYKLLAK